MKACVVQFPASNCDRDVAVSIEQAMGRKPEMVWHGDGTLPDCDLIVLPGGFSYGDYLRCGAMAAQSPIMRDLVARAKRGAVILGICNGFQILTEAGLLPGVLMRNASLKFICKDVYLRVERNDTLFTGEYAQNAVIRMPVAHHDGNYYADTATLDRLEQDNRVAFRYCSPQGDVEIDHNPNGAARNIAGIYNETGTVLGLMPHPERLADKDLGGTDGAHLFASLVERLQ